MSTDSTDLDWLKHNLTPEYVKTALEDLANDQIDLEQALSEQNKRILIATAGSLAAVGLSVLLLKQLKMLVGGLNMIGAHMQQIDQVLGIGPVAPTPREPAKDPVSTEEDSQPPAVATEDATEVSVPSRGPAFEPQPETPAVDVGGGGYDPGPQPGPDAPLADGTPVHDDGTGLH